MASSKVMASNANRPRQPSISQLNRCVSSGSMNMEEILRTICSGSDSFDPEINGGATNRIDEPTMTLEDFLAMARAEVEVRVPSTVINPAEVCVRNVGFWDGMAALSGGGGGGGGRGKRRAEAGDVPMNRVMQKKQRRMIKNRESAARSRQRKQAYTMELESLVTQLEMDNAMLLKEEEELNKKRYKQLMESLIPVVEQQRPPKVLKRVHSMEW